MRRDFARSIAGPGMIYPGISKAQAGQVGLGQLSAECPSLPSGEHAYELLQGYPRGGAKVVFDWVARSVLVGVGMYAAGARGRDLVKYSVSGAAGIELFVLLYTAYNKRRFGLWIYSCGLARLARLT